MAIILRNTKGSALTYEELDGNFTDLNGRVLDSDGIKALIDADYIQANQADIYRDSAFVTTIVDSDYVAARMTAHYAGFDSDFGTKSTSDLTEGTNLYYTSARHDSDTLDLVDSAYVQARMSDHYTGFDSDFGTKTTTNLTEGTNLYYTTARADSDTSALIDSDYIQARETASIATLSEDTSPALGGNLDVNGNTIQYRFNLTASGSDHYVFNDSGDNLFDSAGENDPTLYLRRGETYVFNNTASGAHPFRIQDSAGGSQYDIGVTNNANAAGNLVTFTPRMSAPTTLYYRCVNHATMAGTINIV